MTREERLVFGKWLQQQRERRGMTQRELAKVVDVSPGGIGGIESGSARAIGGKMVRKLKAFFEEGEIRRPAVTALNHMNGTGLEHMIPILRRLGRVALATDFRKRVGAVSAAIGCSQDEAAATIFQHELQRMEH